MRPKRLEKIQQVYLNSPKATTAQHCSEFVQAPCTGRSDARDRYMYLLADAIVARGGAVEVQQPYQHAAAFPQLFYGVSNRLLLFCDESQFFQIDGRVFGLLKLLLARRLPCFQASQVQALPSGCGNNPRADSPVVLHLMQMLKQFEANSLKNVGSVSILKTETYGNGIDQSPVPLDEGFPRIAIALQAHRNQFRIGIGLVFGSAHYRDFLAFQKLSSAKKNMTADEKSTKRRRPVPISGEVTYLRYS